MRAEEGIERLRGELDRVVEGQPEAKSGLLLALVAGEHAYLEGPPGCAKTLLAETFASAAGARWEALHFHRDIRPEEIAGEGSLRREFGTRVERLHREVVPGPLAEAEIAILDDLPRAPGESLAPVLQWLSRRSVGGRPTPLETAIATGLPPECGRYLDPLEPAQLDRFAVQIRMAGLLGSRQWSAARSLMGPRAGAAPRAALEVGERRRLRERAARLPIPRAVRRAHLLLVRRIAEVAGRRTGALSSDRSFGRAALALLRAHALLRGADAVELSDLPALRYMLAHRSPESLAQFETLLENALEEAAENAPAPAGCASGERAGAEAAAAAAAAAPRPHSPARELALRRPCDHASPLVPAGVKPLVQALCGELERARSARAEDPGGQPRRLRGLRRLEELFDADPAEAVLWTEGRLPGALRVYRRERRVRGGRIALLRDVSASMEGRLGRWAGQVIGGVVESARRHHMRVGYVEFNHEAERYTDAGCFFHRRYAVLLSLAATRRAEGQTSYEAPLRLALEQLRAGPREQRHVVLLTDGVPVVGDPAVRRERALARRLGVRVHTVFLGLGDPPGVLDALSLETGGLRFVACPEAGGGLDLLRREGSA